LPFVRDVFAAQRAIRPTAAAPADRDPAVGLGEVMLVETSAQL
jgi:hypothetical protein